MFEAIQPTPNLMHGFVAAPVLEFCSLLLHTIETLPCQTDMDRKSLMDEVAIHRERQIEILAKSTAEK